MTSRPPRRLTRKQAFDEQWGQVVSSLGPSELIRQGDPGISVGRSA